MRFSTCEPNFNSSLKTYQDEADQFYENPTTWYQKNHNQIQSITHLVMFENLYKNLILKNQIDNLDKFDEKNFELNLSKFTVCERFLILSFSIINEMINIY